ncbi:predicted protein [Postia placenta Mad-698-R]|uniref:Fungal-type protein kinase domain-containing protein n=1 Tax=Postia placenta MAD-698-R-SB12 TaxID=670580 RepID=A0A1X6MP94_9APHY|nr:hypothetical protein POSPLADRAFT_1155456 [Postia placenta MAD-698-R-SB12]EED84054.1 predicted protein [Postia placenta Mad-698-R]OSX58056.1 hypothetical protein POSPLADRAFT_1155456 [Postia placenta MAD-698-R-SB12]
MEGEPSSGASKANPSANLSETPVRVKAVQSASYMEGNLDAARRAVMEDLGTTIPEVKPEFFRKYLLPRLPVGVNIDQLVNKLCKEGDIEGNRWAAFQEDPKNSSQCEDGCFESLADVATAIAKAARKMTRKKQLFEFAQNPAHAPKSKTRTSKSRPDGCFIRKSGPKGKFRWMDIALSAEYKKVENAKTKDDVSTSDFKTEYWADSYGRMSESRTELLVSKPIDFMSAHHEVVHFFVAMMYAAEHEAGWDPTMEYVRKMNGTGDELELDKEGKPRLDIDVQDQNGTVVRYRTIRWLSDDGANGLRGRGTRVWEVCIFDKNKEGVDRFALKDQWIDADRLREGMIIYKLRNTKTDDATRDIIDQSLLTVEHHGDVYVEGMLDHTRNLMTRRGEPHHHYRFKLQQIPEDGVEENSTAQSSNRTPAGVGFHQTSAELRTASAQKIYTYHPKVHYRIVFKEVCIPIHEITSLKNIFYVLIDAALALVALHELGWVHRDMSAGNLLSFMQDGVLCCKLTDLEYAMQLKDRLGHEIRTEAKAKEAKPPLNVAASNRVALDRIRALKRGNPGKIVNRVKKIIRIVPFRYNPLHDIESLWWVAIYFVFNRSVVKVGGKPPSMDASQRGDYSSQKIYTKLLATSPHARFTALEDETDLHQQIIYLHAAIREIADDLNEIRMRLVNCYLKAEQDLGAIRHTIGHDLLHDVFITSFENIVSKLQENDIQVDILRNDPRQYVEDPFEIPTQGDVTDDNGPTDDDDTEENSDGGDQGSGLAALTREVSAGDIAEEATAKDDAQDVVVEDPDAGRSVDKDTGPSDALLVYSASALFPSDMGQSPM